MHLTIALDILTDYPPLAILKACKCCKRWICKARWEETKKKKKKNQGSLKAQLSSFDLIEFPVATDIRYPR
jgi:hypothetical protein